MNILWLVAHVQVVEGRLTSMLASVRLRSLVPLEAIGSYRPGTGVQLAVPSPGARLDERQLEGVDVAVVGKMFGDHGPIYKQLRARNIPIVMDLCDDVSALAHLRVHYDSLAALCTAAVVSSDALRERLPPGWVPRVFQIPDAQENERQTPRATPAAESLQLLWYGQAANLESLYERIPELASFRACLLTLEILAPNDPSVLAQIENRIAAFRDRVSFSIRPWSLTQAAESLARCDAVIVPVADSGSAAVKTANRVSTAIWAGRGCVAHPVPSHDEFEACIEIDERITDGLTRLLDRPANEQVDRIASGQALIEARYAPAVVAARWVDTLESVLSPSRVQ